MHKLRYKDIADVAGKPQVKVGPRLDPYALHESNCNIFEDVSSGITHKYPHTIRFALTDRCKHACPYCYEAGRVFGLDKDKKEGYPLEKRVSNVVAYYREHPEIYDIVLSGGEPLMLSNKQLEFVFQSLSKIEHLRSVRFCTRSVVRDPDRIDGEFLALLDRFSERFAIRMVLHTVHPEELTPKTKEVVRNLLRAGAVCFSQIPLLKGINLSDDIEASRALVRSFLKRLNICRIQPYYFVVKMAVFGTERFAMPLDKIMEIFRPLLQHDRDSIGLGLTFKLMAAAPETKVFLYPETKYRFDKDKGGYLISVSGREVFYPYEDPATL